ncbi:MAG: hypothetical protein QOD65_1992 [Gaiellales bacterium]|nr:hypothetical protein [Gaiellales bacterium]
MATVHERRRPVPKARWSLTGIPFAARTGVRAAVLVVAVLACGATARPAGAVIGGQPAASGYFGYVTFVGVPLGNGMALYCTGALVAPSVVLTVAHCALPVTSYVVATGLTDLTDTSGGQVLGVSSVVISPDWNPDTRRGDMALLQLAQPSRAPTMPVISPSDESWAYQSSNSVIVAGWGRTSPSSSAASQLNWLDLAIQSDSYCYRQFTGTTRYDPASMFCASDPGTSASACNGDSGAPAVAKSPSGTYAIVGVVSVMVGESCDPPNAFQRVTDGSAWLLNQIAILQATAAPAINSPPAAPPALLPPLLVPLAANQQARKPPSLRTRPSTGAPGGPAKLSFWPGSNSGRLRVHLRVIDHGIEIYSKTTQYFQPTPRVWALPWRVPRTLEHSVRFCMSATLLASDKTSSPSCSPLRITKN